MKSILNNIKLISGLIVLMFGAVSCGEFEDINIDPKRPQEAEDAYLFSAATKQYMDWKSNMSVNTNIGRYWAQYWAATTYTTESRYDIAGRQIPDNYWVNLYRNVLNDLAETRKLAMDQEPDPNVLANKLAIITIMETQAYQLLVDIFGDVPYSEALDGIDNPSPAYDMDSDIYSGLISNLQSALSSMVVTSSGFGDGDLIYGDDVLAWKKFGHATLMRLGIRLADVDPSTAADLISTNAPNAFESNADNPTFQYLPGTVNGHPLYSTLVVSGRHDHVPAATLVDEMNRLDDPRRQYYMTLDLATDSDYIGLTYGLKSTSPYGNYSQVHPDMADPEFHGEMMNYSEVEFILAEAAERGFSGISGTAEEHYNAGITASIEWWGGNPGETAAYLANPDVDYSTAEGGDPMRAIALQKWLSLYNFGHQGWIEWRRLDWPMLVPPEDMTQDDIPKRMFYPINEPSLNGANYDAASSRIGGDTYQTKVFWDVN